MIFFISITSSVNILFSCDFFKYSIFNFEIWKKYYYKCWVLFFLGLYDFAKKSVINI